MQVSVSCQLPGEVPVDSKEVDVALYSVVGLQLQVRDVRKFPQALGFESLGPFFLRVSKQGPCFTVTEEDVSDKRLVLLELGCEAASSSTI